jgi:hypothetical protein
LAGERGERRSKGLIPVLLPLMTRPEFRFEEFAARHPNSPLDTLRRDLVAFFVKGSGAAESVPWIRAPPH